MVKKKIQQNCHKVKYFRDFLPFIAIFGWNWGKKLSYKVKKKVLKKTAKSQVFYQFLLFIVYEAGLNKL